MRTSSIRDIKSAVMNEAGWLPGARKLVMKELQSLARGRLLVIDNGEVYAFGQAAEKATVTGRIEVKDKRTYRLILQNGMLGAAEAYINGYWHSPDLPVLIRVMAKNLAAIGRLENKRSTLQRMMLAVYAWLHRNSLNGSRRNIAAHYDLGNDFFHLFLDEAMMYSAAVYRDTGSTLEEASRYKLDLICRRLDLQASDHVLEIGSGWGGFACHAARHYGCRVTTTTISREQYDKTLERVAAEGLEDRVTVLLRDYRELTGNYDKLVSIEMIEAVGHEFHDDYFARCAKLLADNGIMLIQAILVSDQRYQQARKNTDFIKRYIFPGGCLPSVSRIAASVASQTDMQITAVEDISYDYAQTLADWRKRFLARLPAVRKQGFSESFIRMWDFYFCYCQAGFMERTIHTAHIVMAKPGWRDSRYPLTSSKGQ